MKKKEVTAVKGVDVNPAISPAQPVAADIPLVKSLSTAELRAELIEREMIGMQQRYTQLDAELKSLKASK